MHSTGLTAKTLAYVSERQESGRVRRDEGREKVGELQGPHRPHKELQTRLRMCTPISEVGFWTGKYRSDLCFNRIAGCWMDSKEVLKNGDVKNKSSPLGWC